MNKGLQPARRAGNGVPRVREIAYATGQTFKRFAILTITSGEVSETSPLTASMTNLYGISLQGAGTNPGYDAANSPTVITGRSQTVSAAKFDAQSEFSAMLYNGATRQTAAASDIGGEYGFTKLSDGTWVMDKAKTGTSAYGTIVDVDLISNTVIWLPKSGTYSA